MLYNDYSKSKNISHDWIRWPCVRVSSAEIPSFLNGFPFGKWYETWIFSECPGIKTTQVTFGDKNACLRAHAHIVKNTNNNLKAYNKLLEPTRKAGSLS